MFINSSEQLGKLTTGGHGLVGSLFQRRGEQVGGTLSLYVLLLYPSLLF